MMKLKWKKKPIVKSTLSRKQIWRHITEFYLLYSLCSSVSAQMKNRKFINIHGKYTTAHTENSLQFDIFVLISHKTTAANKKAQKKSCNETCFLRSLEERKIFFWLFFTVAFRRLFFFFSPFFFFPFTYGTINTLSTVRTVQLKCSPWRCYCKRLANGLFIVSFVIHVSIFTMFR